jgi:hypothetical protein
VINGPGPGDTIRKCSAQVRGAPPIISGQAGTAGTGPGRSPGSVFFDDYDARTTHTLTGTPYTP